MMTSAIISANEDLLKGIRQGDKLVIQRIFKHYQPFIINFLSKRLASKEEAEDIFMIALEAIYEKLRNSQIILDKASFKSYLTQICIFQWNKVLRRKKLHHTVVVDYSERAINDDNLEDQLRNIERERLLAQKIELISPECRQMLVWIFENKKTAFEIAQVLGTKEGNVRKKKYDCKQRLFKLIQEDPLYKELIWSNE